MNSILALSSTTLECALFRSQRRHKAVSGMFPRVQLRIANLLETRVPRGFCGWCREGELLMIIPENPIV